MKGILSFSKCDTEVSDLFRPTNVASEQDLALCSLREPRLSKKKGETGGFEIGWFQIRVPALVLHGV